MTHTTWCRRQARDNAKEHVDCSNCQCHSGEQFTCPVCGHGSGRPTAVDLEWIDGKHLPQKETSEELAVRLRQTGLVRDPDDGIPWVEVCPSCERGNRRCATCGRVVSWWATTKNNCHSCHRKSMGMKPLAKDTQRLKVYNMETRVFKRAYSINITVAEAEKLLGRMARRFRTDVPSLQEMPGKKFLSSGDYGGGRIRAMGVSQNRVCAGTIIHEYSHHLNRRLNSNQAAHGAFYVRCLYEAMWSVGYAEDRPSQARWKVRIGKHKDFWDRVRARPQTP